MQENNAPAAESSDSDAPKQDGTWWVRCKSDPRWNCSGQNAVCDAGSLGHPFVMPPEAEAALANLKRALDADPPEDLWCTFKPNKPGNRLARLHRLCAEHAALSWEKQLALAEAVGPGPWNLNIDAGTISLDGVDGEPLVCPIQLLGTHSEQTNTWLWSCANEAGNFPANVLASVNRLREIGTAEDIFELVQPHFELGSEGDRPWFDGHYLAMVACGLCQADCYYRAPYEGGALFVLLQAPQLRRRAPQDADRMITVLMELICTPAGAELEVDHKAVVLSYAKQKGYTVRAAGEQVICTGPGGKKLVVTFNAAGLIEQLNADVGPESDAATDEAGSKPWWKFW